MKPNKCRQHGRMNSFNIPLIFWDRIAVHALNVPNELIGFKEETNTGHSNPGMDTLVE